MFITLSCFYIPPATLCKTYFCSEQTVKILQGFALSDQAIDPPSLTASRDGSQYLTQQIVLHVSAPQLILRGAPWGWCLHEFQS